ncbi:MAG TPA: TIM-barrel domain-containing protein [Ktedonobacteraceae bacterium]|nr:TIM-barrel domain-containing protein [Ktedonobacteraceae bacterium]
MVSTLPQPQAFVVGQPKATERRILPVYRFLRVEDYFQGYQQSWNFLERVYSHVFDGKWTLSLNFQRYDGQRCTMLIQFPRKDTIRVRFNPNKSQPEDFTSEQGRAIVMDTIDELVETMEKYTVECVEKSDPGIGRTVQLTTKGTDHHPCLIVSVDYDPFRIKVQRGKDGAVVWKTDAPGIYYTSNENEEYSIIQAVEKPATAKYVGFGEHGGKELSKNSTQLTFFNYDNMMYKQVYGKGPFENQEPLYHSDPFFVEFNGIPSSDPHRALDLQSTYGVFIDNLSQIFIDVGSLNSHRYLFGIRFGDLDYYLFFGKTYSDILSAFTSFVGRPKLPPRYVLGYHQGCYGYDSRGRLEEVVNKHRQYQIPLDGLHIDVDLQQNYQTFTIDESKFPSPHEMFAELRKKGVKCSTNITPIISNTNGPGYRVYQEALEKGYFLLDQRADSHDGKGKCYQNYQNGQEQWQQYQGAVNTHRPFVGEVYYGGDRGVTGHYPDLGRKYVRIWWGKQYQPLFNAGIEMVWQDMTTPALRETCGDMKGFPFRLLVTDNSLSVTDPEPQQTPAIKAWNLYSYNLHKATYHGLNYLKGRENKRNFIIGRGSFTGMRRYAGLWTGDNASTWEFLRINIAQVLALGLCGIAICGEDIGGFMNRELKEGEKKEDRDKWADPELLIRWTCAGAFLPWFRNHYSAKDGEKLFQEPYAYQERIQDAPPHERDMFSCVLPICKYYIELRYRLLQLFYDAMFENVLTGLPICRAMFLNDPDDQALYNDKLAFIDDQFFVRNDLLVAPILEPQSQAREGGKRDVYLPTGHGWYTFMDNKRPLAPAIEGGATVREFDARIDPSSDHMGFHVPLYVRAGAIIPTLELEQYVGERHEKGEMNPITLNIYPYPHPKKYRWTCELYRSLKERQGEYTMYLDDGESRSSAPREAPQYKYSEEEKARSEYREVRITHHYQDEEGKIRVIRIDRTNHDSFTPREDLFFVAILHDPRELEDLSDGCFHPLKRIVISGQGEEAQEVHFIAEVVGSVEQRAAALKTCENASWYYNENVKISFVKVPDTHSLITLTAYYA